MSKVVAVEAVGKERELVVICEDGSAWVYSWKEGLWTDMAPVPGTPAAEGEGRQTPFR